MKTRTKEAITEVGCLVIAGALVVIIIGVTFGLISAVGSWTSDLVRGVIG